MSEPKVFCGECRWLSDRINKAYHGATSHVESKCLSDKSPFAGQMMRENGSCCFGVRGPAVDAYEPMEEVS